jgi:hypothetical protein
MHMLPVYSGTVQQYYCYHNPLPLASNKYLHKPCGGTSAAVQKMHHSTMLACTISFTCCSFSSGH